LSTIRAKSGSEVAFIFRMTWPRWTFTVIALMPTSTSLKQTKERDISIGEAGDVSIGDLHD
jgi:hypothetical protein